MKICMMTNTYLPHVGGVARSVDTFSRSFRKQRHRVLVVAPTFEGDETVPARVEKHVVRLPAIQQFNGSDFSVRLPWTWLVNPILQDFRPDIVQSHHPYLLGDSALRYAANKNAPVVFTHHTLHEEYTHYVPFDSPMLKQFVIELGTQYANLCDAIIAPSDSIARLIRRRGVTGDIEVIPTGVNLESLGSGRRLRFRRMHKLPADAFIVGHLGRLAPEKNLGYLARAVSEFLKQNPRAFFLVVGSGSSKAELQDVFEKAGVAERLVTPGKMTGRDVCDAYAAMDVFAFSSHSETQGMVLAEAMAAGLPAVALDASGVREVVRDGVNGVMLSGHAREGEFTEALARVAGDEALRRSMVAGAHRTAQEFSEDASARKTLRLYETVLRQNRRERSEAEEDEFLAVMKRVEVEWALLSEKTGALFKALTSTARAT